MTGCIWDYLAGRRPVRTMPRQKCGRALLFMAAAAWLGFLAGTSWAATYFPTLLGDARIRTDMPNTPDSTPNPTYLSVYDYSGITQHSVLQFDLSSLPAGKVVTGASLTLTCDSVAGTNPNGLDMEIYRVTQPWLESQVTWNSRLTGTPWTTAGGDYVGTGGVQDVDPYSVSNSTGGNGIPITWDVGKLVSDWYSGPFSNEGLLMRSYYGNRQHFRSREHATGPPPQLSVTLEDAQAYYRTGEADPGAAAGSPGNDPTADSIGFLDLPIGAGTPAYSNNTPQPGSRLSLDFSGAGKYYERTGPVTTATDNWGVEAWVLANSTTPGDGIGTHHFATVAYNGKEGGGTGTGFGLATYDGQWQILVGQKGFISYGAPVEANKWTHLAAVRDSGQLQLYVNGTAVGSPSSTWSPNTPISNDPIHIGGDPGTGTGIRSFDGLIDEVRFFSFAPGTFNPANDLLTLGKEEGPHAYEGFDYATSPLDNHNGGRGWGGSWYANANLTGSSAVRLDTSQSLDSSTYMFEPTGGKVAMAAGSGTTFANRALDATASLEHVDAIYLSFLARTDQAQTDDYAGGLYFCRGTQSVAFFGSVTDDQGDHPFRVNLFASGDTTRTDAGEFLPDTTYLIVGKLATGPVGEQAFLKAYAPGETPHGSDARFSLSDWTVVSPLYDWSGQIDRFRLFARDGFQIDEIRIGTSWAEVVVPEPAGMTLLAAGLAALLWFTRRTRNRASRLSHS